MKNDLTVYEAAKLLKTTAGYIYSLLYAGRLEGKKLDGKWSIPAKAVEARLQRKAVRV